jgi:DNA-directed RNA polymerase specialized sigma24 family protein
LPAAGYAGKQAARRRAFESAAGADGSQNQGAETQDWHRARAAYLAGNPSRQPSADWPANARNPAAPGPRSCIETRDDALVSTAAADPADRVTVDESVSMAFLVVLESMTPDERVALIPHDVFGCPFTEVAGITGRSPAACRQLASAAHPIEGGEQIARLMTDVARLTPGNVRLLETGLAGRQVLERGFQIRRARVHRVDRQPLVGPWRELSPAPQYALPGRLGESLNVPGPVLQPVPEDAVIAALDNDELQLRVHLTGKLPPLSTSGLWPVNSIDNDIVSQSELLSGQGRHDEVGSVVGRRGRADSCAPHRGFSLIHSEHGAVQCSPEIDSHRALPRSGQSGHDD